MLKVHFSGHGGSIEIPLSLAAANFLPPAEYVLLCWGGTDVDHWYRQNEHAPCRVLDACDDATMPALDMPDTPPGLNAGMSINGDDHFELATTTEQTIDLIGPQYYGAAVDDDQPVYVCGEQLPMTGYRMIRDIAAVAGDNEWVRQTGGQRSDGVCEWTVTSVGLSNLTSDAWPKSATIGQCPLDVYTSRKRPPSSSTCVLPPIRTLSMANTLFNLCSCCACSVRQHHARGLGDAFSDRSPDLGHNTTHPAPHDSYCNHTGSCNCHISTVIPPAHEPIHGRNDHLQPHSVRHSGGFYGPKPHGRTRRVPGRGLPHDPSVGKVLRPAFTLLQVLPV